MVFLMADLIIVATLAISYHVAPSSQGKMAECTTK